MPWSLGLVANLVIALSYVLIALTILRPLQRTGQLRSNALATATAAIFVTCAVHRLAQAVYLALPWFGSETPQGEAMRDAWSWPLASWDLVGALVAIYYWSLRRSYSSLIEGAALFSDLELRERQALDLNDNVLQGLVVARMSLERGDRDKALDALDAAIGSAGTIITDLLGGGRQGVPAPLRSTPAVVAGPPPPGTDERA